MDVRSCHVILKYTNFNFGYYVNTGLVSCTGFDIVDNSCSISCSSFCSSSCLCFRILFNSCISNCICNYITKPAGSYKNQVTLSANSLCHDVSDWYSSLNSSLLTSSPGTPEYLLSHKVHINSYNLHKNTSYSSNYCGTKI